ncbi:C2H2-type domain-containing protein [Mycena sanguinolenta]|uniref:C2H2-type domain-containing protein n=1 Tax=Mycena sanguinolenta TaxID=230812 RepID=A0A8H6WRN8_9AGAR|nr:C2H2-type domain-containing protein [Mycena sanguinolenta]
MWRVNYTIVKLFFTSSAIALVDIIATTNFPCLPSNTFELRLNRANFGASSLLTFWGSASFYLLPFPSISSHTHHEARTFSNPSRSFLIILHSDSEDVPVNGFVCNKPACRGKIIYNLAEKTHKRLVHQEQTKATYPGETEAEIFSHVNGFFTCTRCGETFIDPNAVGKHVKKCEKLQPALQPTENLPEPPLFPRQATSHPSSPIPGIGRRQPSLPSANGALLLLQSQDIPAFDVLKYLHLPEATTVIDHDTLPLRACCIIISFEFGSPIIICTNCSTCLTTKTVLAHIKGHSSEAIIPANFVATLEAEFEFIHPPALPFPPVGRAPVYGLQISQKALYFCSRCGHGYSTEQCLRSHQSQATCPRNNGEEDERFMAYGQRFPFSRSYFSVDISTLARRDPNTEDAASIYKTTFAPPPDYSRLPIAVNIDGQTLDQFFQRECWHEHLADNAPCNVVKIAALPAQELYESRLRQYTTDYFCEIVKRIKQHTSQGLMRRMAQVSNLNTYDEFRALQPATIPEYAREIVRLIHNCMEQAVGNPVAITAYYPLTTEQTDGLVALHRLLTLPQCSPAHAAPLLHRAIFGLLTQEKARGNIPWTKVTLVAFLIARCMGPSEFIAGSEIGRVVAKLIWGIRGTVLYQMELDMDAESLKTAEAYEQYKKYLTDAQDTCFAYLFNVAVLLKSIRGDHYAEARFQFTDAGGRELSYQGSLINLDDFRGMHEVLSQEYDRIIAQEVFFGEAIPDWFTQDIDIRSLVDDPRNHTAGYCFIDDARNPFTNLAEHYGEWLLSSAERAAEFVNIVDGKLLWKSAPCFRLLRSCAKARRILITLKIVGVGPSIRATEIARDLLRNLSGGSLRSLMILYHNLVIVGTQDKTSHKTLKKRFTPGAAPLETALRLIRNIVYFRRFESDLIRFFRGDDEAERCNIYLWPDICANISGSTISDDLGEATKNSLHVEAKILTYRSILTAFTRYHFGARHDMDGDESYDTLSHHSSAISNQYYGIDTASLANASIKDVEGCMTTSIKWQALIGIDKSQPLKLQIGAPARQGVVLLSDVAQRVNAQPAPFEQFADDPAVYGDLIYQIVADQRKALTFISPTHRAPPHLRAHRMPARPPQLMALMARPKWVKLFAHC